MSVCMPSENGVNDNVAIICLLRCYVQGLCYLTGILSVSEYCHQGYLKENLFI